MEFLNDLGRKFARATKNGSGEEDARAELERRFAALGRAYFDSLGQPEAAAQALIASAAEALRRAEAPRARCPACGAVSPGEARFCAACGKRMPEPAPEPVDLGDDYCPNCGAMRLGNERFCALCGCDFDAPPPGPAPARHAVSYEPMEEPDIENE